MKARELRKLSNEELSKRISEMSAELIKLRGLYAAGRPPKNVMALRNLRKDYARALTVMRERQLKTVENEKSKETVKESKEQLKGDKNTEVSK